MTPSALDLSIAAYNRNPTDPANVTDVFDAIWRQRGSLVDAVYEVPPCPYSAGELAAIAAAERRVGFLPAELATQSTRHTLALIFPLLRSYALFERNAVTNLDNPWGWFDYDAAVDAPYLQTDEESLAEQVADEGRTLASLNQYVVAAQDSLLFAGEYLDQRGTWSRFNHFVNGTMVCSRLDGAAPPVGRRVEVPNEGCLLVAFDLGSSDRPPILGGRSVGWPSTGRDLIDDDIDPASLSPETVDDMSDPTTLDLVAEWTRQANEFLQIGFHTKLGLTEAQYVASLPTFQTQPHEYRGRLDVPLLIETRISWEQQADLAGISRSFGSRNTQYLPIDDRHQVPDQPYAAWVNWFGQRFPEPISPDDARDQLALDELGGNLHELIALHVAHPVLNSTGRFIDAIGLESRTMGMQGADDQTRRNPGLCYWRAMPEIGANLHPVAYSIFRPLIRGTAITTL